MSRKQERIAFLYARLTEMGFDYEEASNLLRIEKTLHRWHEAECGNDYGHIERDEATEKPYLVRQNPYSNKAYRIPIPDKEKGALKRLASIFEKHPDLTFYQQGDPRGCALYVLRKDSIKKGEDISAVYSGRGLALCV